jgi:hypothetical protein
MRQENPAAVQKGRDTTQPRPAWQALVTLRLTMPTQGGNTSQGFSRTARFGLVPYRTVALEFQ